MRAFDECDRGTYVNLCTSRELTYLKLLNKEAPMEELKASIQGCVEVVVRYPGLCRYDTWWVNASAVSVSLHYT